MELRHLIYFVAIAEERSFTRAAERLWVAQPGLSSQIRRLEAELGVKLFERHTRGVNLTDAGQLFLERARAVLTAAEDARTTGRDLGAGLVGAVRLGIAIEAPPSAASPLLAEFADARPDVEVTVVEAYGGTLLRDLRDGRLDGYSLHRSSARANCSRCGWRRSRGWFCSPRGTGWRAPDRSTSLSCAASRSWSAATATGPSTTAPSQTR
jgi:DNA-binding transcriptional LysR family regulator